MVTPTVSVAMATFNGARHLDAQLRSLDEQTVVPTELVVSDDGSTDDTLDVLRAFATSSRIDVRIVASGPRLGYTGNFEWALRACHGDVVLFCDQDDVWHPTKVARFVDAMSPPAIVGAVCDLRLVDEDMRPLGRSLWQWLRFGRRRQRRVAGAFPFGALLKHNPGYGIAIGIRRAVVERALPLPDVFGHDMWALLVASANGRIAVIDDCLVDYRQHADQHVPFGSTRNPRSAVLADARPGDASRARLDLLAARIPEIAAAGDASRLAATVARHRLHLERRAGLPRHRLARVPTVVVETVTGRYARCSNGWRSVVRDLVASKAG